uniref:NADH-ubiquinone oxidoreductase chain 5 n=1 Tax=Enithares tibialis TaxID=575841 RepID=C5HIU6_9HEMI|nr:NADH dehydrogenase subunit 5 [Enithares tibialis]ACJ69541.1 NADH dehydrogenase subunit 5 [Enithares tibialis]
MVKMNMYNMVFLMLFLLGFCFFIIGIYFLMHNYYVLVDWEFLSVNSSVMTMTLLFDWMSLIFMGCVLFISSMVILYSGSYMVSDMNNIRFLLLVILFVISMLMMIVSPNMISILIGWDGLGLVSYCLVIYFQNTKSYNAGMLTILTNRVGDVLILLSIAWMVNFGSWHYIYYMGIMEDWTFIFLMMLVIAGFTKSAQIPFSSWLPAAMAAPTPVSALVHSSTLVTAGVYLLVRFSSLIFNFDCYYLLMISLLTMFMSGLGANFEYDLKKIIALSTLSQLGLMMSILFLGFPLLTFFHLLTHAFFKALLFLCAGLIIHCMMDTQDIRYMGGIIKYLPFTCSCFCISNLSLCGMPFLSGFYSKDIILEVYSMLGTNFIMYLLFFVSIGLTVSYSIRLVYYCISDNFGMYVCQSYFEDKNMIISMIFLTLMSVVLGSMLSWLMFIVPYMVCLPFIMKIMPLLFITMGLFLGYELSFFYLNSLLLSYMFSKLYFYMGSMWFMPKFSTYMIYSNGLLISKFYYYNMDMGWGEYLISNSSSYFFSMMSSLLNYYQNNNIKLFIISFMFIMLLMII